MTGDDKAKDALVNWSVPHGLVLPSNLAKWHKGATYNDFPDKRELREHGAEAISLGWLPAKPLIGPQTRVLAVGSCFASNFTLWLAENGYNRSFGESPYNALLMFGSDFESCAVIAQQLRWAFDELDPGALLWIGKDREVFAATQEGKAEVRRTLEAAEVLILTLGLSEVWYDLVTGEPLWRALTEDRFDPGRHVFRVETMAQTKHWLETIERLCAERLPRLKIVFTVSPIPLKTTFRPVSAVTANSASKAILRAALDEFLREHAKHVGKRLFYFPAYEFVTEYFVDPFREDNRHLVPLVPGAVMAYFVRHYCSRANAPGAEATAAAAMDKPLERMLRHSAIEDAEQRELLVRIVELEEDVLDLQRVCDERQAVIDGIKLAADERLRLIEELHRIAAERQRAIEALEARLAGRAGPA